MLNFGTLYLHGNPVQQGTCITELSKEAYPGYIRDIMYLGDTVSDMPLQFVSWNGNFVATRPICYKICWDDLNQAGFITGRPIVIDGNPYLCRCLKVGSVKDAPNEWDDFLDYLGDRESEIFGWQDKFFWGQEESESLGKKILRGGISKRSFTVLESYSRGELFGFRPILEPLPKSDPNALVGQEVTVYGQEQDVHGKLVEVNDYDIVVTPDMAKHFKERTVPTNTPWCLLENKRAIIDRQASIWVAPAEN